NRKKAELITKNLGNPATLDAAAAASKQPLMHADSVSFTTSEIPRGGREPKVVGASFDKGLNGKAISPAIAGNAGVYFIRVEKLSAQSNPNADINQQKFTMEQQQRQIAQNLVLQQIRRFATVKDYRG